MMAPKHRMKERTCSESQRPLLTRLPGLFNTLSSKGLGHGTFSNLVWPHNILTLWKAIPKAHQPGRLEPKNAVWLRTRLQAKPCKASLHRARLALEVKSCTAQLNRRTSVEAEGIWHEVRLLAGDGVTLSG